ncbi:hypothetical protein MUG84_06495 [Paenibacillus sp. KQZ6P-2]|uniref:Uncharacterized protein n=1 Tax=Paenibacillus mangrovi TaxID=2931978 RepID=A0A9X1WP45_9BACL|nr:hypothetical protein [Paenibacillus mangrovi]MCJ8011395.1 hypothetical protein [Paenibacillus mangrovi]
MKVEKKFLIMIAGIVWFIAGFNIMRIGLDAGRGIWEWYFILVALVVYSLFHNLVFRKMVKKHTARIKSYEEQKHNVFRFFDTNSYLIMAFMITLGASLRLSGLVSDAFIAMFYSGLGASLIVAGVSFELHFYRYMKELSKARMSYNSIK